MYKAAFTTSTKFNNLSWSAWWKSDAATAGCYYYVQQQSNRNCQHSSAVPPTDRQLVSLEWNIDQVYKINLNKPNGQQQ